MAQLISVKLSRFDGSPWGFRLQGGKDFGTPLVVQKVSDPASDPLRRVRAPRLANGDVCPRRTNLAERDLIV